LKARNRRLAARLAAWISSLRELLCAREVLAVRNIRRSLLRYFFAFPVAMIIINVQNLFLTDSSRVLGLPATAFTFLAFALGAISFFLCCREQNVAAVSRTAAWLTLAGGLVWALLPAGTTAFFSALVMMAGIGGCVSCGSFSFVFVLNNTERFFGSALMLLSISLVKLVSGLAAASAPLRKIFALALAAILIFCTASSRQEDYAGRSSKPDAVFNPSIWLTLFVFFSYFAIRITGFYVSAFAHPADSILRGVLTLVPVLLCVGAQLVFRCSAWTLCNVFFLSAILSYVMWYTGLPEIAHIFSVLKDVGLLVTFYLVGCVSNKFCDFRMHKRLVLLSVAIVGLLYLGVDLLHPTMPGVPATVAAVLFAAFLLLSPAFSQYLFFADWSKELRAACMTTTLPDSPPESVLNRQVETLDQTCLSPREKQVALLLLQGMTLRQVAPELGLTASTVATYSKTIYKKLGINSRAELFLLFGGQRVPQQMFDVKK